MAKKSYHVIAGINGGWSVKRADAERASRRFSTQSQAVSYGRKISIGRDSELIIHNQDGRLLRKESYTKDSAKLKNVVIA
jgi:Uncharacterized protein conserved in bacteria (DUF2188)